MSTQNISLRGLDSFSRTFLARGVEETETEAEAEVKVHNGQNLGAEGRARYSEQLQRDFIVRTGSFTEDLVGFIMEQRTKRDLSNIETIFGVALATINLREDYGGEANNPKREEQLAEFDAICCGAQEYYDANVDFST